MIMKEKVESILGVFLDRNKDYAVSGYIRNGVSGNSISSFLIPMDRKVGLGEKKLSIESNVNEIKHVNDISIPYDEVMDCYEERDEYNQQMVQMILKNGMMIYFECVGMRI